VAGAFLFHNRDIHMRVDDSVVRTFEGAECVLRRSRGFAPFPVDLGVPAGEVLACGGELKNTFCLTKGHYALLSQHIGDMENIETLMFFRETLENMKKLFRVNPRVVAYDLHPLYLATRVAMEMEIANKVGVQHHHAHIASCMAEHRLGDKVIGVAFDGTGYGLDGRIWGGEFLVADRAGFHRRAHFRYVPLPGGDAAVRQPWRAAVAHLEAAFGDREFDGLPVQLAVPAKTLALVRALVRRRTAVVDTSSCGRLFDAVASIIGLRHEVNFEGQAAIELEAIAAGGIDRAYPFEIDAGEPWQIDTRPLIEAVAGDALRRVSQGVISARFHNTIARVIVEVSGRIRREEKLSRVCLSGGTFQNMYLLSRAVHGLREAGFEVFLHAKVPPNDGGLSLGQAVVANEVAREMG
jgi:hydrogenase maturation protein HypF